MSRFDEAVQAAQHERDAMQFRKEHGFWPPWHVEFYSTEPMISFHKYVRRGLANSAKRLARLRQINAPTQVIAGELAQQAQRLFQMAASGPQGDHYERCVNQAWKRVEQAKTLGWKHEPWPKDKDPGIDTDDEEDEDDA